MNTTVGRPRDSPASQTSVEGPTNGSARAGSSTAQPKLVAEVVTGAAGTGTLGSATRAFEAAADPVLAGRVPVGAGAAEGSPLGPALAEAVAVAAAGGAGSVREQANVGSVASAASANSRAPPRRPARGGSDYLPPFAGVSAARASRTSFGLR